MWLPPISMDLWKFHYMERDDFDSDLEDPWDPELTEEQYQ